MAYNDRFNAGDVPSSAVVMSPSAEDQIKAPRARFIVECLGPDGEVKWTEDFLNTVFTVGKVNLLDVYFGAVAKPSAWYLVLKGTGTEVAADTLASHASWTERSDVYSAANRPTVAFSAASASGANGQISTSAAVSVAITTAGTVAGAGLTQTQVKATTTGVMYNAGDFSAARTVAIGDTLNVSLQLTIT